MSDSTNESDDVLNTLPDRLHSFQEAVRESQETVGVHRYADAAFVSVALPFEHGEIMISRSEGDPIGKSAAENRLRIARVKPMPKDGVVRYWFAPKEAWRWERAGMELQNSGASE